MINSVLQAGHNVPVQAGGTDQVKMMNRLALAYLDDHAKQKSIQSVYQIMRIRNSVKICCRRRPGWLEALLLHSCEQ